MSNIEVMNFYLVVKHDFVSTKESGVLVSDEHSCLFTDKRNALEELEACAKLAVITVNGLEHSQKCMYDEKRFIRKQHQACIEKKYYITKNAMESPDQLIVWRKYDVVRTKPGTIYGVKTYTETIVEKQFSVGVVRVPSNVWGLRPTTPTVTYRTSWIEKAKEFKVPKGISEDAFIANEHKDLVREYSEYLRSTAVFKINAKRLDQDEIVPLNLPRVRYEHSDEFLKCPLATTWVPEPAIVVAPVVAEPTV